MGSRPELVGSVLLHHRLGAATAYCLNNRSDDNPYRRDGRNDNWGAAASPKQQVAPTTIVEGDKSAGIPRACFDHSHGSIHGDVADTVQGDLEEIGGQSAALMKLPDIGSLQTAPLDCESLQYPDSGPL